MARQRSKEKQSGVRTRNGSGSIPKTSKTSKRLKSPRPGFGRAPKSILENLALIFNS